MSNKNQIAFRILIAAIILLSSFHASFTQSYQSKPTDALTPPALALNPASGDPKTGDFGSIGLYNGRLNYAIPLLEIGGRGQAGYTILLPINKQWVIRHVHDEFWGDNHLITNDYFRPESEPWWNQELRYMPGKLLGRSDLDNPILCEWGQSQNTVYATTRLSFVSADGSEISLVSKTHGDVGLPVNAQCSNGNPTSITPSSRGTEFVSNDGSGVTFVSDQNITDTNFMGGYFTTTGVLYFPDGTHYRIDSGMVSWMKDRNGNRISFTYDGSQYNSKLTEIIDSMGREVNITYGNQDGTYGLHDLITYAGFDSGTRSIRVSYDDLDEALRSGSSLESWTDLFGGYGCPTGVTYCPDDEDVNPEVVSSVWFPGDRRFRYYYNSHAELARVETPQGAAFEYDWGAMLDGGSANGVVGDEERQVFRQVLEKRVYPNGGSGSSYDMKSTISQSAAVEGTEPKSVKTVTAFDNGNNLLLKQTHHFFGSPVPPFGPGSATFVLMQGKEYETNYFGSDGTTLYRRDLKEWANASLGGVPIDARLSKQISIVVEGSDALASLDEVEYDNSGVGDFDYFKHLNSIRQKKYHFVAQTASTATSASLTTALSWFNGQPPAVMNETDFLYDVNYKARHLHGLPVETRVKDSTGNVKAKSQTIYDEVGTYPIISAGTHSQWVDPSTNYRANPTTTKSYYDITNSYFVQTHAQYDNFGNLRKSWDANGNLTETVYSSTYAYAYPTSVITPVPDSTGTYGSSTAFTTSRTYDYGSGLALTATDANSQTTTMEYDDPLLRPTKVTAPNGAESVIEYGAGTSPSTRWVKVKSQIDATNWKEGYTWFDGLGRNIRSQSIDTESGDVFTMTCYDALSRVLKISNPFQSYSSQSCSTTSGMEWRSNTFDITGRLWKITTPDSAVVEATYGLSTTGSAIGTAITVADQAGKLRRSITNALGELIRVDEPNSSNVLGATSSPNQDTSYTYDPLNNPTTVTQGSQTRTFAYDALKRLKQAVNPESGTIDYTYDANGNLATKTDARSITTTYTYDTLNRVTLRDYSDSTPDVTYYYDNLTNAKGKLKKVTSSVSTTEYTGYDILGRVTAHKQTTDGNDYTTAYTYNLGGALIEETYPSGRVVKNVLDNNGDLEIVQSKKNSSAGYWNYAENFTFNPAGAVTSLQLGNGHWESTTFNSRLQPTQIALGTTGTSTLAYDLLKLNYTYGTTANNGNVLTQTITVPTVGVNTGFEAVQTYTYDSLNRINDAVESVTPTGGSASQSWEQTFTYDRYGNRRFDEANTSMPASFSNPAVSNPTISTSTNRLTSSGYTYDNAGNMTTDAGGQSYTYDAENKMVTASNGGGTIGQYYYDGDGKRIKKGVPGSGETTIFVYDAAGKQVAEYSTIVETANAQVAYLTNDHLGSPRINTDQNGAVITRHDYHPFGEAIYTAQRTSALSYITDTIRKQFTGYERDTESDLDFAQARYSRSALGRFSSPDPLMASAQRSSPQTFNRYSYVVNNPMNLVDPSGMSDCPPPKRCDENGEEIIEIEAPYDPKTSLPGCGFVLCVSAASTTTTNPNPTTNPFRHPFPGGPLSPRTGTNPTGIGNPTPMNFGRKVIRSAPAGLITFGLSLLVDELINPSQSVGNDPCDQGIPDCGEKKENRKTYYRGVYQDGTDPEAREGTDLKVGPDGIVKSGGISFNTDPSQIPPRFGVVELVTYPRNDLRLDNTGGTHYNMVPVRPMTVQQYREFQQRIIYGRRIR